MRREGEGTASDGCKCSVVACNHMISQSVEVCITRSPHRDDGLLIDAADTEAERKGKQKEDVKKGGRDDGEERSRSREAGKEGSRSELRRQLMPLTAVGA